MTWDLSHMWNCLLPIYLILPLKSPFWYKIVIIVPINKRKALSSEYSVHILYENNLLSSIKYLCRPQESNQTVDCGGSHRKWMGMGEGWMIEKDRISQVITRRVRRGGCNRKPNERMSDSQISSKTKTRRDKRACLMYVGVSTFHFERFFKFYSIHFCYRIGRNLNDQHSFK